VNGSGKSFIGKSPSVQSLFRLINSLAEMQNVNVLLAGESGTGKELLARAIHYNRENPVGIFVPVNCPNIPVELFESELFGHVKGSFTGAHKEKEGLVKLADNGTLFLDEISEVPLNVQARLLRVLDQHEIRPVGGTDSIHVNFRLVSATNKDLEEEISEGRFRKDLYYRISTINIPIPSLTDRREDIPLIADGLVERHRGAYGLDNICLDETSKQLLFMKPDWHGNVRELENIIHMALILAKMRGEREYITREDIIFGNSELLKRIGDQQKTDLTKKGQDIENSLWYQKGVLPIGLDYLSKCKGTKSIVTLTKLANDRVLPSERVGVYRIVYLTPSNIGMVFRDYTTEDYGRINREIIEGRFNQIVLEPFKLFSPQTISRIPSVYSLSSPKLDQILERMYRVLANQARYSARIYAIQEGAVEQFISPRNKDTTGVEIFKQEIREAYQKFQEGPKEN